MEEQKELVVCPCCGIVLSRAKFCYECGTVLKDARLATAEEIEKGQAAAEDRAVTAMGAHMHVPVFAPLAAGTPEPALDADVPASAARAALSDQGLTLLVNTCKKTCATVGGDGYTEIVLYEDPATGAYWLHTYSKYDYMAAEAHASYAATPELARQALDYITEHDLASYKDFRGVGLCGGDYIIRFKHGDEYIRLSSSNMPADMTAYWALNNILYSGATEENRRYAD